MNNYFDCGAAAADMRRRDQHCDDYDRRSMDESLFAKSSKEWVPSAPLLGGQIARVAELVRGCLTAKAGR